MSWPIAYIGRQIRLLNGQRISCLISSLHQDLKRQIQFHRFVLGSLSTTSSAQAGLGNFNDPSNNEEPGLKGIVYARVSSSDQTSDDEDIDEGSIDDQIHEGKRMADKYDVPLGHEPIVDKAKTGTNFNREGIQKVFRIAQRDEIGYLFIQSIDRIGRTAAETLYFIHLLQSEFNITLITAAGERDTGSISGLMHTTLLSLMADVQNDIRTTKAKKSRVRAFLKNKQWNALSPTEPVGYKEDGDGWLEPDPTEKEAGREMFDEFCSCENYSSTDRKINEKYEGVLEGHRVKTLLQNPVYIGKPKLPDEWLVDLPYKNDLDEPHLQLIDEDTFQQAQEIIERKDQLHTTGEETYSVTDFVEKFNPFAVVEGSDRVTLQHDCGEPMVKDGQRDLKNNITTHRYYCEKCDEHRQWPREEEYDQMELIYQVLQEGNNLLSSSK